MIPFSYLPASLCFNENYGIDQIPGTDGVANLIGERGKK
jgi:hypothetical protein